MTNLKYKYRLYPTIKQSDSLNQIAGNCRFVWKESDMYKQMVPVEQNMQFMWSNQRKIIFERTYI